MSIFEYDEEATLQYIRECEYDEGLKAGKAEDIIDLLEEIGTVSNELRNIITSQTDIQTLRSWLKFAANAQDVAEFQKMIAK